MALTAAPAAPAATVAKSGTPEVSDMSILDFVAAMTDSLAWPLVVMALAFFFRRQAGLLLRNLESFAAGGLTWKFKDGLQKAEKIAEIVALDEALKPSEADKQISSAEANEGRAPFGVATPSLDFAELVRKSPNYAVVFAWMQVEGALYDRAVAAGFDPVRRSSPATMVSLVFRGIISPAEEELIEALRELRNVAVHSARQITFEEAMRYKDQVDVVMAFLKADR